MKYLITFFFVLLSYCSLARTNVSDTAENHSYKLLSDWLKTSGLYRYFRLDYFYDDESKTGTTLPIIKSEFDREKVLVSIAAIINRTKNPKKRESLISKYGSLDISVDSAHIVELRNSKWYDKTIEPNLYIHLTPLITNDDLDELELKFTNQNSRSLWDEVFHKIQLITGAQAARILVGIHLPCSDNWLYGSCKDSTGHMQRQGERCKSVGTATLVVKENDLKIKGAEIADPFNNDLGKLAEGFLKNVLFKNRSIACNFLERSPYAFDVIIRGIKGEINKGANEWEKIDITCLIVICEEGKCLRIETDGLYTGGNGKYPPDNEFTYSFQPGYASQLQEFSTSAATSFLDYIKSHGK